MRKISVVSRLPYPPPFPPVHLLELHEPLRLDDEGRRQARWGAGEKRFLPSTAVSSQSPRHLSSLSRRQRCRKGTDTVSFLQSIHARGGGGGDVGCRVATKRSGVADTLSNRHPGRWRAAIQRWYGLPQASRYFVSGNLGNVVFFLLEKSIHQIVHEQSDLVPSFVPVSHHTLSFLVAYMAQVVPQHLLHALLVYGIRTIDTPAKYFKTLAGTYSAFAMSMVGSTLLNSVLVKFWSKDAAFVLTIVVFATVNYFFISWIVQITAKQ